MSKKVPLIHIFFIFIAILIKWYHVTGSNLIWNMFLALLAIDFAYFTYYLNLRIGKLLLSLLWLFFFPNTFYMLTDIVHIHFAGSILTDHSSMIYYILYMSSILFGVLCGIESLKVIFVTYQITNYYGRLILIGILSFVSSFAIHIGRYARLNSWDILTKPRIVVHEILEVVSWNALPFILGFTFLQFLCLAYLENEKLINKH